ncbi:cytochrome P450 [Sphingomonas ginsenosidivorax]|uniref:Cytochrome P450 n=1 Tax=Sphingomonas ginsenosidivorax TaxID=862135 RepID=A0A5C6UBX6_9SPHN|nr:cytochrome P450 [Sphingomonas ginsenosidivorax]TXC70209.1 cytochrome P450 [Sphingomonas ginsenosidivorax]
MTDLAELDYFSDHSILKDPYAYFEAVRAKGPIHRLANGIVVVTGFDQILDVIRNTEDFSSVIAPQGPAMALPFTPEGPDITPQIEAHRTEFLGGDLMVSLDDRPHKYSRSLLNPLFTPSRLRANDAFISAYSDELVRAAVARGSCDLVKEIATPFVTMVIADLLGVPADDRQLFMDAIENGPPPGSLDAQDQLNQNQPLVVMAGYFINYVTDRRETPRDDILSELANGLYPDGSKPDAMEIVRLTTFLFGAGQDTSAKLIGNAMRFIVEQPGLQQQLRDDPSLIPALMEEVLRLEGSTKMTARLARKDTRIGDLAVPAGTKVMLALAAANRDPRRWTEPEAFILDRPKIKEHLAFGRGGHVCAGAPLARAEVRVLLEKFLEHTAHIDLVEAKHGPRGARTLEYEPSFIIRGLAELHLELTPAEGFVPPETKPEPAADAPKKKGIFGFLHRDTPVAAAPRHYTTAETKMGVLLGDPAACTIIDRHFPGVTTDKRIGMAKGMPLRMMQKIAPGNFTDEGLDAIDAEFAKLPKC